MGIIAAGQITVVDLSDAPVLNAFITASRPTTQTYSKDSKNYNPSYVSTPQVLTLNVTKSGSTTSIIDSISGLHWFVVDGSVKTEITSKVNTSNEYISGNYNENLTTKLNIDTNKSYRRYEATGVWRDPSTDLDVQFSANIDLLLTQNGATGPQGPQGDDGPKGDKGDTGATGNGIANTVVTYGLSMSDTTEPATWSSDRPALVKGMYLWTRTVIIYTNGESTTSYQISYIPKDADATAEIDKTKQELLEKLVTVRDDSLAAVEEAKQQLETVRNDSLAAAEEAKQQVATVANDLSKAKTDFQNAVNTVDTKATNVQNDLSKAKQDLTSQAQQLQKQANAQSELTKRVSSVEETANGTKTTVGELSKTVDQNSKNITSVTARTKVVEDDLSGTKTTLSQVKMTADSNSQKTATLETGLDGLSAKFEKIEEKLGGLLTNLAANWQNKYVVISGASAGSFLQQNSTTRISPKEFIAVEAGKKYTITLKELTNVDYYFKVTMSTVAAYGVANSMLNDDEWIYSNSYTFTAPENCKYVMISVGCDSGVTPDDLNTKFNINLNDWVSIETKLAEYKQTADQNYASLSSTVQNLDGTVQHNKTVAEQTAEGFKTRIESLETYKSGESTRANQYFELAKTETARQLSVERTAIAKDYVAKSTYTSDVTGIRNDLTATTTTANTIKTNLANYQATNDRAVASLQSNIQTANGDISSLKTKVEAVPGQITSAVSAVESKIPTEIGSSNLLRNTAVNADNLTLFGTSNSTISVVTKDGHQTYKIVVSATNNSGALFNGNAQYYNLIKDRSYTFSFWVLTNKDKNYNFNSLGHIQAINPNSDKVGNDELHQHTSPVYSTSVVKANTWTKVWCTFKATSNSYFKPYFWYLTAGDEIYIYDMMLNEGNIPLSYTPAFEDTQSKITNLNTTLTQTADGLKQLSTQVTSQGSTITSHTNSINSLTTGLQAKVSQSDFNTLSGRVTTAENNIIAKANELSSKITSVEGKIPIGADGRNLWIQSKATGSFVEETLPDNHITGQKKCYRISNYQEISFNIEPDFSSRLCRNVTFSAWVKYENVVQGSNNWNVFNCFKHSLYRKNSSTGTTTSVDYITLSGFSGSSDWKYITYTYDYSANKSYDQLKTSIRFNIESAKSGTAWVTGIKIEIGSIPSDYSAAPEDTAEQISSLSSQIKQTADGITLLATKTELNSTKSELQSGINTATNKANAAQTTANNAQTTANSNAQTISTHTTQISALNTGLNAKVSQSDFNTLSGRVTTAENNITAKANELSSKITSVEGKIPTSSGGRNLAQGTSKDWSTPYTWFSGAQNTCPSLYKVITDGLAVGDTFKTRIILKYTNIVPASGKTAEIWLQGAGNVTQWNSGAYPSGGGGRRSISGSGEIVFELTDKINADHLKNAYWDCSFRTDWVASGSLQWKLAKAERGMFFTDWQPAPEDAINQISTLSSEFKQTTDSIKASVQSLDNNTVKNSSLTINADGIVMKAGKSTTDVANAIGSYFAVNQNAINLFSDKINVKGHMIVSGSISSDKIASSGITANVIKGGTLQSLNGSTNFELDSGKLFYNNNNTGVFRIQNGASTMGLKFSNTSVTVNGTSRILSRVIMGGDRRETTLDDGKWEQGGFTGIVAETINGVASNAHDKADSLRAIGDNIYFTHSYEADTVSSTSAAGWKMETFPGFSTYTGNVVLKPYGVNYRNSNIVVGDLRLDNGDGSGYWVRGCIRTLRNCFQHYLNGGTTSGAMNAIRDALKEISGV